MYIYIIIYIYIHYIKTSYTLVCHIIYINFMVIYTKRIIYIYIIFIYIYTHNIICIKRIQYKDAGLQVWRSLKHPTTCLSNESSTLIDVQLHSTSAASTLNCFLRYYKIYPHMGNPNHTHFCQLQINKTMVCLLKGANPK